MDPGGTTGWALWDAEWETPDVSWGQVPGGLLPALDVLADKLKWQDTTLVIERYTIGERTVKFSRQSDALEITGALKVDAGRLGVPVVMQQPRDAKRLFTDDRLRQTGWWAKGEEHARDALRHLGFYCARKRLIRLTSTDGV